MKHMKHLIICLLSTQIIQLKMNFQQYYVVYYIIIKDTQKRVKMGIDYEPIQNSEFPRYQKHSA